jgi:hypothetical protein
MLKDGKKYQVNTKKLGLALNEQLLLDKHTL